MILYTFLSSFFVNVCDYDKNNNQQYLFHSSGPKHAVASERLKVPINCFHQWDDCGYLIVKASIECVCVCNPLWISFIVVVLWCLTYNLCIDLSCSPHTCLLYILQLSAKYDETCTYLVALLRFSGYKPAKS